MRLFRHTKLFPTLALISVLILEVALLPITASQIADVTIGSSGSIIAQPSTTIFSDGFESGSASAWTGYYLDSGGSTITVQSSVVHTGRYAEMATLGTRGASWWSSYFKDFATTYSTLYVSAYIQFSATPTTGNYLELCPGISDIGDNHDIEYPAIYNNGGTMQWALMYRTNSVSINYVYSSTPTPTINTWYWLQIEFVGASGTGETRLYVNGADVADATGLTNNAILPQETSAGASSNVALPVSVYVDDVSASTNYINPSGVLSASILPQSGTIYTNETVTFTATVSGGVSPYTYSWVQNGSIVNEATINTWNFVPPSSGTYNVYANVTDSNSAVTKSNTATITVLALPSGLSVTLNSPINGSQPLSTSNVTFSYTPLIYADTIRNASLWMNLKGTWQAVANNASAIQNDAQNTFSYNLTTLGTYIWNVEVFNSTTGVFASSNNSLTITGAVTTLTVVLNSPSGSQQISTSNVTFAYTPTCYGDMIKNASLWTNVTGSWSSTTTNASVVQNAMQNTFSWNLSSVGTYTWNVQVFNSTTGVFAVSNMSVTITTATLPWIKCIGTNTEYQNGTIVYLRGVNFEAGFTASCTGCWEGTGDTTFGTCYTQFSITAVDQCMQRYAAAGFNCLRLHYFATWVINNSTTNLNGETTNIGCLKAMEETAQEAEKYGIVIIYDYYADQVGGQDTLPFPTTDFPTQASWVSFMVSLAQDFSPYPNVMFDLMNEPCGTYSTWLTAGVAAVNAMRAVTQTPILIQYGYCAGFDFAADFAAQLGTNDNIIYENHIYNEETGATMNPPASGGPTTVSGIESVLDSTWDYGVAIGHYPVIIGEAGAYLSFGSAETTYYTSLFTLLNSWNVGYCAWEWDMQGTGWDLQSGSAQPYTPNANGQVLINAIAAGTSSQSSTSESLPIPANGASQQKGAGVNPLLSDWEGNQLASGGNSQSAPVTTARYALITSGQILVTVIVRALVTAEDVVEPNVPSTPVS